MARKSYYTGTDIPVTIVGSIGDIFLSAWIAMLLLGAAHSSDARIPNLSYWVTFALAYAVRIVMPAQKESR